MEIEKRRHEVHPERHTEMLDGRSYEVQQEQMLEPATGHMHLDLYEGQDHILHAGFEYAEASRYRHIEMILEQEELSVEETVISDISVKREEMQKNHHKGLGAKIVERLIGELEHLPLPPGKRHLDLLYRYDDYGESMSQEAWRKVFTPIIEKYGYKKDPTNYLGEDTYYRIVK